MSAKRARTYIERTVVRVRWQALAASAASPGKRGEARATRRARTPRMARAAGREGKRRTHETERVLNASQFVFCECVTKGKDHMVHTSRRPSVVLTGKMALTLCE